MKMFCFCLLSIHILLHSQPAIALEAGSFRNNALLLNNITIAKSMTTVPTVPAIAAKLVRFRQQPPITIVRHLFSSPKSSKSRRRIKWTHIKNGPSNFSYRDPIMYYIARSPISHVEPPSFSNDDFQHLNVHSTDFDLPPSSYEDEEMDLDFYSHKESSSYSPKEESVEYSGDNESSNLDDLTNTKINEFRTPHQSYGVPIEHDYSSSYQSDISKYTGLHSYSPPIKPSRNIPEHPSNLHKQSSLSYDSKHQIRLLYPESSQPMTGYKSSSQYETPPSSQTSDSYYSIPTQSVYGTSLNNPSNYPFYDKNVPNSGYNFVLDSQNFAEPPISAADVEIMHSPSYEINILPRHQNNTGNNNNYQATEFTELLSGNFAEPPESSPPSYQIPEQSKIPIHFSHPYPGAEEDYRPPSKELPLNPNHKQPTYDFPKSSYEVPIYDPIPFEASNNEEQESYPPQSYNIASIHYKNQEQNAHMESIRGENYISPNHHSLLRKPIANLSMDKLREDSNHLPNTSPYTTMQSPHLRRTRKRQRVRSSTKTSSTKHILDVPELKLAFEAGKLHNYYTSTDQDTDVNESNYMEEKRNYRKQTISTETPTLNNNHISHAWNPMRIRTVSHTNLTPTRKSTVTEKISLSTNNPKQYTIMKVPQNQIRKNSTTEDMNVKEVAILSIAKSRSHSYYDGTIASPTQTTLNLYRARLNNFRTTTGPPPILTTGSEPIPKGTKKHIVDTTFLKSLNIEKEVDRRVSGHQPILPKNHKLY